MARRNVLGSRLKINVIPSVSFSYFVSAASVQVMVGQACTIEWLFRMRNFPCVRMTLLSVVLPQCTAHPDGSDIACQVEVKNCTGQGCLSNVGTSVRVLRIAAWLTATRLRRGNEERLLAIAPVCGPLQWSPT